MNLYIGSVIIGTGTHPWQGMGHTFPTHATDYNREAMELCWKHIEAYLQDGTLPVNGMICWQKTNPPVS